MRFPRLICLIVMVLFLSTIISCSKPDKKATAQVYLNRGIYYAAKKRYDKAISEYKKFITLYPDSGFGHFNLGCLYSNKGMYNEAIVEYKQATAIDPNDVLTHEFLGCTYTRIKKHDEAIDEFQKAIQIDPGYARAHISLSSVYFLQGKFDLSIKHCDEAISLGAKIDSILLEKLKPYRKSYGKYPAKENTGFLVEEAASKRYDSAIVTFKTDIAKNPYNVEAYCALGNAYSLKDMHNEAIVEYKKALAIDIHFAEAHAGLAMEYFLNEQYALAIEHHDKAIDLGQELDPDFLKWVKGYRKRVGMADVRDSNEMHFRLAENYQSKEMYDEANTEYKKAITLDPNDAESHYCLGINYAGAKEEYDEAIAEFKKALTINSNYAEAYTGLGMAYFCKGMHDEAITACKKAVTINPDDGWTHAELAKLYYVKKQYDLANKHCDKAIELEAQVDPDLVEKLKKQTRE